MLATISLTAIGISMTNAAVAGSWDYDEPGNNASHWPNFYAECGYSRQSPIDLPITPSSQCTEPLEVQWTSESASYAIRNTGFSLKAVPFAIDHNGGADIGGLEVLHHNNDTNIRLTNSFYNTYEDGVNKEYCFDSLHFHWGKTDDKGSEHTVNGQSYPLEVHLVHYSCDYQVLGDAVTDYATGQAAAKYDDENVLAVLGVIFEIGEANPILDQILEDVILNNIYEKKSDHVDNLLQFYYTEFNVADLLPESREIIAYLGSLTTPPCFETVRWHVLKERMTVSEEQMAKFRMLLHSDNVNDTSAPNFRPIMPLNDRTVYQCQEDVEEDELYADKDDDEEYTSSKAWGYDKPGKNASNWAELYAECGYSRQSPIDLPIHNYKCDEPLEIEWTSEPSTYAIKNTGYSLLAMPFAIDHNGGADISGLEVLHHTNDTSIRLQNSFFHTYESNVNKEYCFDSLHFHWGKTDEKGSEHTVNGKAYPLEVHLVHYSCDYQVAGDAINDYATGQTGIKYDDSNILAVVGVIFEIGAPNPVISKILDDVILDGVYKKQSQTDTLLKFFYTEFDLKDLLPESREVIGYLGSLTTPPCFQTVRWHVLKQRMTVSEEQMAKFRMLLASDVEGDTQAPNFRPIMPLNDRTIYRCGEDMEDDAVYSNIAEKVEYYAEQQEDGMSDSELKWRMMAIAFIVLFCVALLGCIVVIICLCKNWNSINNGAERKVSDHHQSNVQMMGAIHVPHTSGDAVHNI